MGIEPTSEAWEASILPLYDARSFLLFGLYTNRAQRVQIPFPPCRLLFKSVLPRNMLQAQHVGCEDHLKLESGKLKISGAKQIGQSH